MTVAVQHAPLRFTILGELAMGGMGRVELARLEETADQYVAVKRLHAHLAHDRTFLQMFVDEVWVTSAVDHENVVRLLGWGADAQGLFFATEFVDGGSLASLLRRKEDGPTTPIADAIVAYVGSRVAAGLAAAHSIKDASGTQLELVHRDITPANVLVGWDGRVKIADFGIAKARIGSAATATGVLKGKVWYMAPEYVNGRTIDARADLYSLGVVLYELASGERPFDGPHEANILKRIVDDAAKPLREHIPSIDPDLAAIIEGLLAKDSAARPASAAALLQMFDAWLDARRVDRETTRSALGALVATRAPDRLAQLSSLKERTQAPPYAEDPRSASSPGSSVVHRDRGALSRLIEQSQQKPTMPPARDDRAAPRGRMMRGRDGPITRAVVVSAAEEEAPTPAMGSPAEHAPPITAPGVESATMAAAAPVVAAFTPAGGVPQLTPSGGVAHLRANAAPDMGMAWAPPSANVAIGASFDRPAPPGGGGVFGNESSYPYVTPDTIPDGPRGRSYVGVFLAAGIAFVVALGLGFGIATYSERRAAANASSAAAPVPVPSTAPLGAAVSGSPLDSASASGSVAASSPSLVASASAGARASASTPPSSGRGAGRPGGRPPTGRPTARPTTKPSGAPPAPAAPCTPHDFDYPRCLSR